MRVLRRLCVKVEAVRMIRRGRLYSAAGGIDVQTLRQPSYTI